MFEPRRAALASVSAPLDLLLVQLETPCVVEGSDKAWLAAKHHTLPSRASDACRVLDLCAVLSLSGRRAPSAGFNGGGGVHAFEASRGGRKVERLV